MVSVPAEKELKWVPGKNSERGHLLPGGTSVKLHISLPRCPLWTHAGWTTLILQQPLPPTPVHLYPHVHSSSSSWTLSSQALASTSCFPPAMCLTPSQSLYHLFHQMPYPEFLVPHHLCPVPSLKDKSPAWPQLCGKVMMIITTCFTLNHWWAQLWVR